MKILLVEDNQKLSRYIKEALEQKSYSVERASDGEAGEQLALRESFDVIILDLMLPLRDGITVCKHLRAKNVMTPILMLTAKGELEDKVEGLDSGADDYLVKPFELPELLARIRSLLRRPQEKEQETLAVGDIVLDSTRYAVEKEGSALSLTLREYAVLEYLMRNRDRVVTRDQILEHCWDFAYDSFSNIVDVYIKRLREKLDDEHTEHIKTVRGVGYQFTGA